MRSYTIINLYEKDNISVFHIPGEGKVISLSPGYSGPGSYDHDNRPTVCLSFESVEAIEKLESALVKVMASLVKEAANE